MCVPSFAQHRRLVSGSTDLGVAMNMLEASGWNLGKHRSATSTQPPLKHQSNTSQTPLSRHRSATSQTPLSHHSNTTQPPVKHHSATSQTPLSHLLRRSCHQHVHSNHPQANTRRNHCRRPAVCCPIRAESMGRARISFRRAVLAD